MIYRVLSLAKGAALSHTHPHHRYNLCPAEPDHQRYILTAGVLRLPWTSASHHGIGIWPGVGSGDEALR
jgi:hypothetical protein